MSISTSPSYLTRTLPEFRQLAVPLFANGTFKAPVGAVLPMAELTRAHQMVDDRKHFGKIVLEVS
jgi:NADPH:quinone reductase-like Zn-dependent oxidoreductase